MRNLLGPGRATEISGQHTARTHGFHALHEVVRRSLVPKPPNHLRRSPESADRVGYAFARDIEGAAVNRLEHAGVLAGRIEVGCRRNAD